MSWFGAARVRELALLDRERQVIERWDVAQGELPWSLTWMEQREVRSCQLQVKPRQALPPDAVTLSLLFDWPFASDDRIFCNGYQTWTESREFAPDESIPSLRPWVSLIWRYFRMQQYSDYTFAPYSGHPGVFHSYSMIAVRQKESSSFLASMNEAQGYTTFRCDVRGGQLWIEQEFAPDELLKGLPLLHIWAMKGHPVACVDAYFEARGLPFSPATPVSGWTSWYHYYTAITQENLRENIDAFQAHEVPIDVFQIDDGWQESVGDWYENDDFQDGMKALADRIHEAGMRAGLWLAPFICEASSRLCLAHPDWLLRAVDGSPMPAGRSLDWGGVFYALDTDHPEVIAWIEETFARVFGEWGFDLVKLDFLYAAALRNKGSRGAAMDRAMKLLARVTEGREVLGCGVPLGAAFGRTKYCRIGSDVALRWEDWRLSDLIRYRERVSTLNSLRSTIGRALFSGRAFLNDPDVFLLREHNTTMTPTQRETLFRVNIALGGLVFTSDPVASYSPAQWALYNKQFPHFARRIVGFDGERDRGWVMMEEGQARWLLIYNLTGRAVAQMLPSGAYWRASGEVSGELLLKPYESAILKQAPDDEPAEAPLVLASTGHLFPGRDILLRLDGANEYGVSLALAEGAIGPSEVLLCVPPSWPHISINGVTQTPLDEQGQRLLTYSLPKRGTHG